MKNSKVFEQLIYSTWSKEDKENYRKIRKRIRLFNRKHYSFIKMLLMYLLETLRFFAPFLLSLLGSIMLSLLFGSLSNYVGSNASPDAIRNTVVTILSIESAVYLGIIAAGIIALNNNNSFFGLPENRLFWASNGIGITLNSMKVICSTFYMAMSLVLFLLQKYSDFFQSCFWTLFFSMYFLFSIFNYRRKSNKEKLYLYLKPILILRKSTTIHENRVAKKEMQMEGKNDVLFSKVVKIEEKRIKPYLFMLEKAKSSALRDRDVKEDQDILELLFKDYSHKINTPMQLLIFIVSCEEYLNSFSDNSLPKENTKNKALMVENMATIMCNTIKEYINKTDDNPIRSISFPKVFLFKREHRKIIEELLSANYYYSFLILAFEKSLDCLQTAIDKNYRKQKQSITKQIEETKTLVEIFKNKNDCSKTLSDYIDQQGEIYKTLLKKLEEMGLSS